MTVKIADQVVLQNNVLQPQDFVRLRVLTGFADIPIEHAKRALDGGLINVSAIYGDQLIGMGRMVGDGAMYWYLQEIIVLPEFQKQGVGAKIVNHLVDYAVSHSTTGKFTTIGVYTDNVVHTARSSSACFPLFQCTLSAA